MSLTTPVLPPISIVERDLARLETLSQAASKSMPLIAEFLANEIARAEIETTVQRGLVVMGATVTYVDNATDEERIVTLVYPDQTSLADNRVSVLSPLGAALIGLSVGQTIDFPTHSGRMRSITVRAVNHAAID